MTRLLITTFAILFVVLLHGQDLGQVVSPQPNDTVINGELIVVFRLDTSLNIKPLSVDVLIDNLSYKYLTMLRGNKLSVLVSSFIKTGEKTIEVRAKDEDGNIHRQKWNFTIVSKRQNIEDFKEAKYSERKDVKIKTRLDASSRFSDISGEGASLRQEPREIHKLNFQGKIQYKNIEVPIKLNLSNHERYDMQPRNRFMIGVKSKSVGILFGDVNPRYNRLTLYGSRIRGGEAYAEFRNARLSIVYGTTRRAVEGLRHYYNSLESEYIPPVNLEIVPNDTDSVYQIQGYYNEAGFYQRRIIAVDLSFGSSNTNNEIHITILRSTDDTTSIDYGGQAAQNISIGLDTKFRDKSKKFKVTGGISAALTTRDIRYGASSKDHLEDMYNIDLPFDTQKFEGLFVYNTSSTILTWDHTPFLAYYLKPEYKFGNQRITAEIKRIGSDFQSFGNPYLINDRLILSLSDQMFFFKKHLYISLRLKHFKDNLAKTNTVTLHTNMADASFNLLIKSKLPRFTGGYRIYLRDNRSSEVTASQYRLSNIRFGINYSLNYKSTNNSIVVMVNRNDRYSFVQQSSVFTNSINLGFTQSYPFGLNLALQYNLMLLTTDSTDLNRNNTYSAQLGYRNKSNKYRISVKAGRIRSYETEFYPGAQRDFYNADLNIRIWKDLEVSIEVGIAEFQETGSPERRYDELWGQVGIRFLFYSGN